MVVDCVTPVSIVKGYEVFSLYARTDNSLYLDRHFGLDSIYTHLCVEDEARSAYCLVLMKNPELGLRESIRLPIPDHVHNRLERALKNIESPDSWKVGFAFASLAMRIGYIPVLPMEELQQKHALETAMTEGYVQKTFLNHDGTHREFAELTRQFSYQTQDVDSIITKTICWTLM